MFYHCASGGTRTRTVLLPRDFKSLVSTIPPPRQIVFPKGEAQAGFEPANISFANCRVRPLRHCAIRVYLSIYSSSTTCANIARNYLNIYNSILNMSCRCFSPRSSSKDKNGSIPSAEFSLI